MPGRSRTTKKLAQRIDLNYFKKLQPIPRWRRILSVALTAIGLGWLGWAGLAGKQQPFNAGPLATSHALLANNCASCHATQAAFGKKVTETACLSCHDAPVHHTQQVFTPTCESCHIEHQGTFRLAMTRDASCTACHADLKTKDGRANFAQRVTSFNSDHPEFALLRTNAVDPGTIKFGHQVHLKKDLRSPTGFVQMTCSDCHLRSKDAMLPVNFEKHCASCHPLQFDRRFAEAAPHKDPQIVRDFVASKFTQYIAAHPAEIPLIDPAADPRIITPRRAPARNAPEWIAQRMEDAQTLLWRKSCKECHDLQFPRAGALPQIPKAAITTRWMMHAQFDHKSHQLAACNTCHGSAGISKDTKDILLPKIETCRQCHSGGEASANSQCSECHLYHDWSKEKPVEKMIQISAVR